MFDHCIIGSWERPEKLPRCASTLAHQGCRFAAEGMDCEASSEMYDACPYRQSGGTIAVYPHAP